jgi:hypothetical protein
MRSSGVLVPQRSLCVDEDGGSEERGADNVAGHAVATTLHMNTSASQRASTPITVAMSTNSAVITFRAPHRSHARRLRLYAGRQDGRRRLGRRRVGQGTGCRRLGRRTARNPDGAKNARSSSGRSAAFLSTDILI